MKKLFSISILIVAFIFLFSACSSLDTAEVNEIVKSAIDLSNVYLSRQDYESALNVYNRALKSVSDYRLLYNKIQVLISAREYRLALDDCLKAIEKFPHIMKFRTTLSDIYMKLSDSHGYEGDKVIKLKNGLRTIEISRIVGPEVADAIAALENALQLNPFDKDTRLKLIDILSGQNNPELLYSHYLILWEQGLQNKDIITKLYEFKPDEWLYVYNFLTKK